MKPKPIALAAVALVLLLGALELLARAKAPTPALTKAKLSWSIPRTWHAAEGEEAKGMTTGRLLVAPNERIRVNALAVEPAPPELLKYLGDAVRSFKVGTLVGTAALASRGPGDRLKIAYQSYKSPQDSGGIAYAVEYEGTVQVFVSYCGACRSDLDWITITAGLSDLIDSLQPADGSWHFTPPPTPSGVARLPPGWPKDRP